MRKHAKKRRIRHRGQALAEAALVAGVMVLVAMLGLTAVPIHRAHTAAMAAVYACAQFMTQYPNQPDEALRVGYEVANQTLNSTWNALAHASFRLQVYPPRHAGEVGTCSITYSVRLLFDPLGIGQTTRTISLDARSERWAADW